MMSGKTESPVSGEQRNKGTTKRSIRVLAAMLRVLTGKQLAGRNVTVFDDDVFIVSYPRSGNTWTRFLVGNLIYEGDPITFSNIEARIPEIYLNPDHKMRRLVRPRILKSHECFQPEYRQVIYVVRDPRDVCVSNYHHNVKWGNIPDDYPMDKFVPRFLRAEFDRKCGSWADNVNSWLYMREKDPRFLLLRYEDMKREPVQELGRVASFLERHSFRPIRSTPDFLLRAVQLSTPERMRSLESFEARKWALTRETRQDKPFVRTAVAGTWKAILSKESLRAIGETWGSSMKHLGYELLASN